MIVENSLLDVLGMATMDVEVATAVAKKLVVPYSTDRFPLEFILPNYMLYNRGRKLGQFNAMNQQQEFWFDTQGSIETLLGYSGQILDKTILPGQPAEKSTTIVIGKAPDFMIAAQQRIPDSVFIYIESGPLQTPMLVRQLKGSVPVSEEMPIFYCSRPWPAEVHIKGRGKMAEVITNRTLIFLPKSIA